MILGGLKYHRAVLKESSSIHCAPKESSWSPKGKYSSLGVTGLCWITNLLVEAQ